MKFIPSFAIELNVVNLLDFIKKEFDETIYLICNDTVFFKLCMITIILLFVVNYILYEKSGFLDYCDAKFKSSSPLVFFIVQQFLAIVIGSLVALSSFVPSVYAFLS